jgi:hypothetical protein
MIEIESFKRGEQLQTSADKNHNIYCEIGRAYLHRHITLRYIKQSSITLFKLVTLTLSNDPMNSNNEINNMNQQHESDDSDMSTNATVSYDSDR